jgi:hypothetical protein
LSHIGCRRAPTSPYAYLACPVMPMAAGRSAKFSSGPATLSLSFRKSRTFRTEVSRVTTPLQSRNSVLVASQCVSFRPTALFSWAAALRAHSHWHLRVFSRCGETSIRPWRNVLGCGEDSCREQPLSLLSQSTPYLVLTRSATTRTAKSEEKAHACAKPISQQLTALDG